jgi:type VI protein secretion system component VasF
VQSGAPTGEALLSTLALPRAVRQQTEESEPVVVERRVATKGARTGSSADLPSWLLGVLLGQLAIFLLLIWLLVQQQRTIATAMQALISAA